MSGLDNGDFCIGIKIMLLFFLSTSFLFLLLSVVFVVVVVVVDVFAFQMGGVTASTAHLSLVKFS